MREEEKKQTSRKSTFRRIIKKRWALPAIYIASAAIILTAALFVQNGFDDSANPAKESETGKNFKDPAVEVNSELENIKMPAADSEATVIKKQFYDVNGTKEEQEAALVSYNNRYEPNKGIDIAMEDGKTFDVVASLSGVVKNVKEDALLGNEITIEHDNGVVTHYQSVKDVAVAVGDKVEQGQALAKAGQSLLNEEAGLHVHFEIRKDNVALNPIDLIDKQLSSIEAVNEQTDNTGTENENAADPDKAAEEDGAQSGDKAKDDDAANSSDNKAKEEKSDQQSDKPADEEKGTESDTNADQPEDSGMQDEKNSDMQNNYQQPAQN
ncbi:M23 family peptidase [Peribacillus cavernae]|uniref:M23 family peptidase n=1 Tax=Peribacillus cavernae TaxID=1674310 RepID=A0A433HT33_9BACI|nr:M23 family metallopeptidase [Peribacillus cavernae]MDQ0218486.1 stage II sporulation protein Q [Peribacillus cavernae]RUQ31480.1 M23 family peptidase [Peribacillus cavernae]